ncbi:nuclear transport factor 2 family protein [Mucilaginibacter aquaedulcis]|uniref:nuclear transport factor 2 family protein n=1 Tax=Mucilaginibacter aquaedulcis TaxID=1187081 RepID=UPI0025B43B57|nr:nuclear transport factor 2 family protein [Mucilaginibacter aquaedulcis]MDN3548656.1 nuclear transport factor 2 family protein [Mucilaginibacter aquaedulcis]
MKMNYYQLVTAINKAFEKNDLELLATHLHNDVTWQIIGSKPIHGKDDFLKCCSEAPLKNNSVKITINTLLVDGAKAAAEGIIEAETLKGKAYRQYFCDIYYFEDDLIKTMSSYIDTAYDREVLDGSAIYQNN